MTKNTLTQNEYIQDCCFWKIRELNSSLKYRHQYSSIYDKAALLFLLNTLDKFDQCTTKQGFDAVRKNTRLC